MAELPGGVTGVGKEMLERGIGGLTKAGTAQQAEAAMNEAGQRIGGLAGAHDAAGGAPVALSNALQVAKAHALELQAEPTTRKAGEKLANLISEYEAIYSQPVPATKALALKRALGEEAYGATDTLNKVGDKMAGDYGRGVAGLERGVNASLENTLGPEFTGANTSFRRLLGASQAAERQASRGAGNEILSLKDAILGSVAGAGAHAAGLSAGPIGLGTTLGSMLLKKYGSQVGARSLYGIGRGLEMLPGAVSEIPRLTGGAVPSAVGELPDNLNPQLILADMLRSQKVGQ